MRYLIVVVLAGVLVPLAGGEDVTPAEYLAAQPRPVFHKGHTLLPLTRREDQQREDDDEERSPDGDRIVEEEAHDHPPGASSTA